MATISKTYKTETAHIVRNAFSERCKFNVHGHSYKWVVHVKGHVNEKTGMVIDFGALKPIKDFIDQFDHAMVLWEKDDINFIQFFKDNTQRHIIMKKNTTAENMASLVYGFVEKWLVKKYLMHSNVYVQKVEVWETDTGRAIATSFDEDDIIVYSSTED